MKFTIYKDKKGEWRWRITASNGRTVADSAEGYARRSGAVKAAMRLALSFQRDIDVSELRDPVGRKRPA